MCGIAGVVSFNSNGEEKIGLVEAAIKKLHKRGPDHTSTYTYKNVAFGHARLSIIDTSNAAHQPFTDASGRYTIVFNGEFFNFKEHRAYVESKGITLKSESDTEVLLYLYIIDGEKCLSKINGFFAFAIQFSAFNLYLCG
jgi:asparagine synthase (glutamine-hydrolysing)